MSRAASWTVAILMHAVLFGAILDPPLLRTPKMPEVLEYRGFACSFDVPPFFDLKAFLREMKEEEVQRVFHDDSPSLRLKEGGPRCIRYEYDSGAKVTVLLRHGHVRATWLGEERVDAQVCPTLLLRRART